MDTSFKPELTIYHCINAIADGTVLQLSNSESYRVKTIKLPCASMVKDVFLLRAFEAGSDAVVVLVCPVGQCRYVEGNLRAKKRVQWVQKLLDEIELDGRRLSLYNIASGDVNSVLQIIQKTLSVLSELGPSPAA